MVGIPRGRSIEIHAALILLDPLAAERVVATANSQLAERQQIKGFTIWREQDFPRTHTLKVKKNVVLDMISGAAPVQKAEMSVSVDPRPQQDNSLYRILSEISGVPAQNIAPEKSLGKDLDLDSLRRVELLSVIEDELSVYIDEIQIGPYTTVGQLLAFVARGSGEQVVTKFPSWGRKPWCRLLRGILLQVVAFPLLRLLYSLKIIGREHIQEFNRPRFFAANHSHHMDNGLIMKAMLPGWRRRLAIAARSQMFRNPFWAVVNPLMGNGFPFSQEGAIRPSLNNLGRILDEGWSVLIYPEGKLTIGGPIQPFKGGTGFIAVEAQVSVIPVKLIIENIGKPWQFPILRRGKIESRFGKEMTFSRNMSYLDATKVLEEAVKAL